MLRYFFHLHDDLDAPDGEGREFESDHHALAEAVVNARALASARVLEGALDLRHRIVCVDENDREVGTVSFGSVVSVAS